MRIIPYFHPNTYFIWTTGRLMKFRYYSSSVNSIFQKCMCSNPVNLMSEVWSEHASFFIFFSVQIVKTLAILGSLSPEHPLVIN